jgi:hypothetical protein
MGSRVRIKVIFVRSLSIDRHRITLPELTTAHFLDITGIPCEGPGKFLPLRWALALSRVHEILAEATVPPL